jgi:fucose 4-O-acetylase-like acetyltransferase
MKTETSSAPALSRQRVDYLDVARGIAIICIILGHFRIGEINRFVYTFDVPLFFMITGYFINEKTPVKEFVKRKVRTLIVPYFITGIVILILGTITGFFNQGSLIRPFRYWLMAVLYGSGSSYTTPFEINEIGPIWFLWATFFSSILIRLLLKADYRIRPFVVAAAFAAGYFSAKYLFWFPLSIQIGLCASLFVYAGYLFRKYNERIKSLNIAVKIVCFIAVTAIWVWFIITFRSFWLVRCDFGRGLPDIARSLCACAAVFAISFFIDKYLKPLSKILTVIGKNSIFILCIHAIEINLFPFQEILKIYLPDGYFYLRQTIIIILDVVIVCGLGFMLSMISSVRKAFGMKA